MENAAELDQTLARLEGARAKMMASIGSCLKAAIDLDRFLASAAKRTHSRAMHDALYGVAEHVGKLPSGLATALRSMDARPDARETARGVDHRVALGANLILDSDDETVLADVEKEFLHAIAVYDDVLETLAQTPGTFVLIVDDQRRLLLHLHHSLRAPFSSR